MVNAMDFDAQIIDIDYMGMKMCANTLDLSIDSLAQDIISIKSISPFHSPIPCICPTCVQVSMYLRRRANSHALVPIEVRVFSRYCE